MLIAPENRKPRTLGRALNFCPQSPMTYFSWIDISAHAIFLPAFYVLAKKAEVMKIIKKCFVFSH
jgi:hypothetical protein